MVTSSNLEKFKYSVINWLLMTKIVKDDGLWDKSPLGIKHGNLKAWRDKIFSLCPNPEIGSIVVTVTNGKLNGIGYRCLHPDGSNTIWERVKNTSALGIKTDGYIDGVLVQISPTNINFITETSSGIPCTSEGVYLSDGVYIDPDECWF